MSGGNKDTGTAASAGPPRARNQREGLMSSSVPDHERRKVPAISLQEPPGSCSAADRESTAPAGRGSLESYPALRGSWKEAAMLLASAARLLAPDPAKQTPNRAMRADLLHKLEELEQRLRDHDSNGPGARSAALLHPAETFGSPAPLAMSGNGKELAGSSPPSGPAQVLAGHSNSSALTPAAAENRCEDEVLKNLDGMHQHLVEVVQAGFGSAAAGDASRGLSGARPTDRDCDVTA